MSQIHVEYWATHEDKESYVGKVSKTWNMMDTWKRSKLSKWLNLSKSLSLLKVGSDEQVDHEMKQDMLIQ